MQRLCTLTLCSLLAWNLSLQAQTQFRLNIATQNASSSGLSQEFGIIRGPYSAELQFLAERIDLSDYIQVDAGISSTVYEWDRLQILDERGENQNFGNEESTSFQGILNASYIRGPLQINLQSVIPVNDTLIKSRAIQASVGYKLRKDTLSLELSLGDNLQEYPAGFYVDPLFRTRTVPEEYRQTTTGISFSQAINSKVKLGGQLRLTDHHSYRPSSLQARAAVKYALKSWAFLGFSAQHATDINEKTEPLDGSGFYQWTALQSEASFEPMLDLILSASYAWILEHETSAGNTRTAKLGADQVGLKAQYTFSQITVDAGGSVLWHSTKARRAAFQGGVTWTL